jgi:hypothetical protein
MARLPAGWPGVPQAPRFSACSGTRSLSWRSAEGSVPSSSRLGCGEYARTYGIGEQVVLLTRLADELGGRADGWSSTLAPARDRPVLEVVSLATRRGARVVAEAGSLWWWPQVV